MLISDCLEDFDDTSENNTAMINNIPKSFVKGNLKDNKDKIKEEELKAKTNNVNNIINNNKIKNKIEKTVDINNNTNNNNLKANESETKKEKSTTENKSESVNDLKNKENEDNLETIHRQYLLNSKKGDRDGFLLCLEK